jgi:hypothetical protein
VRYLALVACAITAACGRVDFAARTTVATDAPATADAADPLHDEDGDGIPDVDDNCPWIAAAQPDTDGDGVGDACDPDPTAQNHIALFVPFTDIPPGWTTLGAASWSTAGDDLVAHHADLEASVMVVPGTFTPPYALYAAMVIDMDSPDSNNYTLSIVDTLDTASVDSEKCGMVTPAGLAIGHEMAGNTVEANTVPWTDAMIDGDEYTLAMHHAAGAVTCIAVDATTATQLEVDNPEYRTSGQIGLRTRNQDVRFHYFAIVE